MNAQEHKQDSPAVVAGVRAQDLAGILDRAEVLFCPRQYLGHVAHEPVAIFAVGAVKLFDEVEIGEVAPVEDEVVGPAHLRDAIDGKAGPLVEADAGIEHEQRQNHAVDHLVR
jgi:hypothetical protein